MTGINEAIKLIESGTQKYFINNVNFKDVLNEEILKDATLWANCLMDSLPSPIASKIDAFRIIKEEILGKLIFELLKEDKEDGMHRVNNRKNIYSLEAEQSVLGCAMLDSILFMKHACELTEDDFFFERNKNIFKSIKSLQPGTFSYDLCNVLDIIKKQNILEECGGEQYIIDLVNNVPSATNIKYFCDILIEKSKLRKIIKLSEEIIDEISVCESENPDKILVKYLTFLNQNLKRLNLKDYLWMR